MKGKASIRRTITFLIVICCVLLVVSYTFMLRSYLERGLDLSSEFHVGMMVRDYLADFAQDKDAPLRRSEEVLIYKEYGEIPMELQQQFPRDEIIPGRYFSYYQEDHGYLLHRFIRSDDENMFLVLSFRDAELTEEFKQRYDVYWFYIPIFLGLLSVGTIFFIALFMIRRVARPVEELSLWAGNLEIDNLERTDVDFKYEELNQLATLFKNSMTRLSEGVEREKKFQQYASHELRTPIAILQNNLELQERLGIVKNERYKSSYVRMFKAVKNMRSLSEILLWIFRKENHALPETLVSLKPLIKELVAENKYLLEGKGIELGLYLEHVSAKSSPTAARILIGNIVRNAFQHTHEGEIFIKLQSGKFEVYNSLVADEHSGNADSFGLGLELIFQLAEKMQWKIDLFKDDGLFIVQLILPAE